MHANSFASILRFWAQKEEDVIYDHTNIVLSTDELDQETVVVFSGGADRLWFEKRQQKEAIARAQQAQQNAEAIAVHDFHLLDQKTVQVKYLIFLCMIEHLTNSQAAETLLRAAKFAHEAIVLVKAVMGSGTN